MTQAYVDIQNQLSRLFSAVDHQDWKTLENIFAEHVFLDYSSYTGIEPDNIKGKDIIASWAEALPQFDATHHQIGNVEIYSEGCHATVHCHGTATHYKKDAVGGDTQQVIGDYVLKLENISNAWRIVHMKFNFTILLGNKALI